MIFLLRYRKYCLLNHYDLDLSHRHFKLFQYAWLEAFLIKICPRYISKRCFGLNAVLTKDKSINIKATKEPETRPLPVLLPKVVFFGTDMFALKSLIVLIKSQRIDVKALKVVTTASLGKAHVVYKYCLEKNIPVSPWPIIYPIIGYDLGVVVSFGYLIPNSIIQAFPLGIINVHGSLLPKWRGAAPIIHSVLNGDQETGITIMKIKPLQFDVGDVLYSKSLSIGPKERSKELTRRMADLGAECLEYCINNLHFLLSNSKSQSNVEASEAPKVKEQHCQILWEKMSPVFLERMYCAFSNNSSLWTTWKGKVIKLITLIDFHQEEKYSLSSLLREQKVTDSFQYIKNVRLLPRAYNCSSNLNYNLPGSVKFDWKTGTLIIQCYKGTVQCSNVVINGKGMTAKDFNNGYLSKVDINQRFFH